MSFSGRDEDGVAVAGSAPVTSAHSVCVGQAPAYCFLRPSQPAVSAPVTPIPLKLPFLGRHRCVGWDRKLPAEASGSHGNGGRQPEPGFPPSADQPFCSPVGVSASGSSQASELIRCADRCVGWWRGQVSSAESTAGPRTHLSCVLGAQGTVWFPCGRPDPTGSHPRAATDTPLVPLSRSEGPSQVSRHET